jgi:hypothetical protein
LQLLPGRLFACGGDSPAPRPRDTDPSPTSSPRTRTRRTARTDADHQRDRQGESSTGEPAPFVPILARGGLEIDWVEANQGVGVKIGADGEPASAAPTATPTSSRTA